MKELSIEQKAQRYDEAIEKAKECHIDELYLHPSVKDVIELIFPELKESEDEKIRKKLLSSFKGIMADADEDELWYGLSYNDIIAWLEKQAKQKPINKILLGKKYKCIASPRYSTFMKGEIYKPEDEFLCSLMNLCSDCFEPIEDGEQKPVWSEEDERYLSYAIHAVEDMLGNNGKNTVSWLKSLKNRVQPKQEWSEEDEHRMVILCQFLKVYGIDYYGQSTLQETISWVKSLRPQKQWKPSKEMLEALYKAIPENVMEISEDEMLLDKLYQGLKYGRVLSKN